MGFRTPPSSFAPAVDTGTSPADPGVRVLTDTTYPGNPQGIVEWRTGLMDRNARATLSGGASGGSAFTIDGGASMGINAPRLALNVESAAAGGYWAVARIDNADVFYLGGRQVATVGGGWTADLSSGTYNAALAGAGTWGTIPSGTVSITVPAGQVLDVEFRAPFLAVSAGGEMALRLTFNGATADALDFQCTAAGRIPGRLAESIAAGAADLTVAVAVQALLVAGSCSIQASAGGPVVLRHRIR